MANRLITKDACRKFYDATKPLYLETNAYGIDFGTSLLQMWEGMNCRCEELLDNVVFYPNVFASTSLSSMERQYSNTEREPLSILHGLIKFLHYCLAKQVYVITDHKLPAVMISKNVAALLQQLQLQYAVYTPIQHAHSTQIWIWAVHSRFAIMPQPCIKLRPRYTRYECEYTQHYHIGRLPVCTCTEDILVAMEEDLELQMLQRYIIRGWPSTSEVLEPRVEKNWPISG